MQWFAIFLIYINGSPPVIWQTPLKYPTEEACIADATSTLRDLDVALIQIQADPQTSISDAWCVKSPDRSL